MFKVGDKVREIHRNVGESRYFYTNGKSVSEIVKINDDRLNIKILHAWSLDQVGTKVWVDASRMELIEEKVEPKVEENRFDKFTNRELGFMAGRTLGKINNQYMIELLRRMEEGVE
jgi:hypothetical protein